MTKFKKVLVRVLGFRSRTPWKGIVASVYYLTCILVFVVCMITPPLVPADLWDVFVFKLSSLVIFLWMLSPAIFLSDTSFRRKLPFFKMNTRLGSVAGMLVVYFFFTGLFSAVESWHSPHYKEEFRGYIERTYQEFVDAGETIDFGGFAG